MTGKNTFLLLLNGVQLSYLLQRITHFKCVCVCVGMPVRVCVCAQVFERASECIFVCGCVGLHDSACVYV